MGRGSPFRSGHRDAGGGPPLWGRRADLPRGPARVTLSPSLSVAGRASQLPTPPAIERRSPLCGSPWRCFLAAWGAVRQGPQRETLWVARPPNFGLNELEATLEGSIFSLSPLLYLVLTWCPRLRPATGRDVRGPGAHLSPARWGVGTGKPRRGLGVTWTARSAGKTSRGLGLGPGWATHLCGLGEGRPSLSFSLPSVKRETRNRRWGSDLRLRAGSRSSGQR